MSHRDDSGTGSTALGCSVRGQKNIDNDVPCQDGNTKCTLPGDKYVIAAADGLGSASLSHVGSDTATQAVVNYLEDTLVGTGALDEALLLPVLREAFVHAREQLYRKADSLDEPVSALNTTLLVAVGGPAGVGGAAVGDGGIVCHRGGQTALVIPRESTEYENKTIPLQSDNWESSYRSGWVAKVDAAAVFSDGLDGVAWGGPASVSDDLFDQVFNSVRDYSDVDELERFLEEFLDGESLRKSSRDDKTLVIGALPTRAWTDSAEAEPLENPSVVPAAAATSDQDEATDWRQEIVDSEQQKPRPADRNVGQSRVNEQLGGGETNRLVTTAGIVALVVVVAVAAVLWIGFFSGGGGSEPPPELNFSGEIEQGAVVDMPANLFVKSNQTARWWYSVDGDDNQSANEANGTRMLNTMLSEQLSEGDSDITVYARNNSVVGSETVTFFVDKTAPSIPSVTVTNPDGQDVSVSFDSNENLSSISLDLSGPENETLTESDFTNNSGTYKATYNGGSDGTYTATLEAAEDAADNDGANGQSNDVTVDTTAPMIPADSFSATNPQGQDVSVSFDSSEELTTISVDLSGPENATLTEDDFVYDAANGTYTAIYNGSSDGTYTATLETAEDSAGNDGAEGQSDEVTVDTTALEIPDGSLTATNIEGQNISVSFESSEQLQNISVDLSGPENATLTEDDFTYDATNGTYTAIYEGSSDGTYNATLETAEDSAGNDGAESESDEVEINTTAPDIPDDSFSVSEEPGQNVSVTFNSTEDLQNISVDLSGPENATLTEDDFTYDATNGTYTTVYNGSSDGTYNATLETAEDSAGNDGAENQNDSVEITPTNEGTKKTNKQRAMIADNLKSVNTDGKKSVREDGIRAASGGQPDRPLLMNPAGRSNAASLVGA